MTPEQEVLNDLLTRLAASDTGIAESLELIGEFPKDIVGFGAMSMLQRVASTGLLKQVEQLEEGLRLKGLYPFDIRLSRAYAAIPLLRNAMHRIGSTIQSRGLLG